MQKEIFDSTLRDGSHAIAHQFTRDNIREYCRGAELAGLPLVIVGHGNGLGASSFQVGMSLLSDNEMLEVARQELHNTKLGAFMIPGFGTIRNNLQPAIDRGIQVAMIACHCTEANITRQHLEYVKTKGLDAYGVLMMTHMASPEKLLEQAKLMQEYGVDGVLLMDSAGALLPDDIKEKVGLLANSLDIKVGYHGHNNLGLAIAGSVTAIQSGATFIDATSRGLGAGAGNCQLEVLVAVMQKLGYDTGLDLYKLMDLSDLVAKIMKEHNHVQEISMSSLASGIAGIFSGFKDHAIRAAKEYGVDVRDIFMELGKRKAVGGQEDLIVEIAKELNAKRSG